MAPRVARSRGVFTVVYIEGSRVKPRDTLFLTLLGQCKKNYCLRVYRGQSETKPKVDMEHSLPR